MISFKDLAPPKEFDNTMLTTADGCMRAFALFYWGLEQREEPSCHLGKQRLVVPERIISIQQHGIDHARRY